MKILLSIDGTPQEIDAAVFEVSSHKYDNYDMVILIETPKLTPEEEAAVPRPSSQPYSSGQIPSILTFEEFLPVTAMDFIRSARGGRVVETLDKDKQWTGPTVMNYASLPYPANLPTSVQKASADLQAWESNLIQSQGAGACLQIVQPPRVEFDEDRTTFLVTESLSVWHPLIKTS